MNPSEAIVNGERLLRRLYVCANAHEARLTVTAAEHREAKTDTKCRCGANWAWPGRSRTAGPMRRWSGRKRGRSVARRRHTPEEEADLVARVRRGDRAAADELYRANVVAVFAIARRYANWGVPLEDLIQEGAVGMLTAMRKFDPARGVLFKTYAAFRVAERIQLAVALRGIVQVKSAVARLMGMRLSAYQREYSAETGDRGPIPDEVLAKRMKISVPQVRNARAAIGLQVMSSSAPATEGSQATHEDFFTYEDDLGPEEDAIAGDQLRAFRRILAGLTDRERTVVLRRAGGEELRPIAETLGLSRERIRQIEKAAIAKVRRLARELLEE